MTDVIGWLDERRNKCGMTFHAIDLSDSNEWQLKNGLLEHNTGGFFSIGGIASEANGRFFGKAEQPIIYQPEIGILGFIVREMPAGFLWLVQAKAEPGNQELVQLAPTVQATYSNYTRLHGGAKTHYLSYFTGARESVVVSDCLQSEQGTRFAGKFNRNSMTCVDNCLPLKSDMYRWVESAELKRALLSDYTVNTDARSVITTAPWAHIANDKAPFSGDNEPGSFRALCCKSYRTKNEKGFVESVTAKLEQARRHFDLHVQKCPLNALDDWKVTHTGIECKKANTPFEVGHYMVDAPEREVSAWDQPLIQSLNLGEVTLVCQVRAGSLRVFLAPAIEIGLAGGVEYGASYQSESWSGTMCHMKRFLEARPDKPLFTILQSDEGGRFMKSRTRYSIVFMPETEELPDPVEGLWVTLAELEMLCRTPKLLTNEARSCVSLLLGIA